LWFSDYHHYNAPVGGKILFTGEYAGSYFYGFDNYDPNDPFSPTLTTISDRAGWYRDLGKHKRQVIIIDTQGPLGMVAMMPVGFWGVGGFTMLDNIKAGSMIKAGDAIGHFDYW
jgi:phosphatidylserine decarboxylase